MPENSVRRPILETVLTRVALTSAALSAIAFTTVSTPVFIFLSFLIIPAIILFVAPTIALWTLTSKLILSGIKRFVPRQWSLFIALAATLVVFTMIPVVANLEAYAPYKEATAPLDILPKQQVKLAGDILILGPQVEEDWHRSASKEAAGYGETRRWACGQLCMMVLDTPGVTSVTLDTFAPQLRSRARSENARTYRLLPKLKCPTQTSQPDFGSGTSDPNWALRLSTELCLVASTALVSADQTIEQQEQWFGQLLLGFGPMELDDGQARAWSLGPNPVLVERLQLFDSAGQVLLRRSIVRGEVNTVPLVIGMEDVWKGPTYFRWGRTNVSNARSPFEKIKPIEILRRYSSLGAAPDGAPTPEMLRDRLELLVSQPSILENDPAVGLIDVWFRELGKSEAGASERDMVLLERIIAHPSITKYSQIYNVTQALDAEGLQRLRRAVARRIVKATKPDEWIAGLASIYSRLPPGGADSPNPDETKILANPELRKYTPELIVRESAKGAEAAARLMSWLKFHTYADRNRGDDKWDDSHRRAIDAVRRGLCVLGPEARAALPQVEAMVSNGAVPMALSDADEWQFVMARLGKPLNTISKPPNRTGTVGDYRSLLANRLDGFDAKESCRANWI